MFDTGSGQVGCIAWALQERALPTFAPALIDRGVLEAALRQSTASRSPRMTSSPWPTGSRPGRAQRVPVKPARVIMQDFTGVPAVVDLAAMRDAMRIGGDPNKINPLIPVDLVIDHSVRWTTSPPASPCSTTPSARWSAIANATNS